MSELAEFGELIVWLAIWFTPPVLFTAGCGELSKWFWSREVSKATSRHPSRHRL